MKPAPNLHQTCIKLELESTMSTMSRTDRVQWRARILQALAELRGDDGGATFHRLQAGASTDVQSSRSETIEGDYSPSDAEI
jgi:hypothetical protein